MTAPDSRTSEGLELLDRIDRYLRAAGVDGAGTRVVPLTGDASDRRYFRIIRPDEPSMVLALHVGPIEFASLPFANVAELLRHMPLPVPALLGHSDPLGIVALEDLGDVTLQAHLGASTPTEHAALYREAVAFIELLQRRGAEVDPDGYIPYRIAFDAEKLRWEPTSSSSISSRLPGRRCRTCSGRDRRGVVVDRERAAAEPRVLCHRDYHSRNLMLHGEACNIIDFRTRAWGLIPTISPRCSAIHTSTSSTRGRRSHRLLLALKDGPGRPRVSAALRRHGPPAEPQGARHVRLPDDRAAQHGLHSVCPHASIRAHSSRSIRVERLRQLLVEHIEERGSSAPEKAERAESTLARLDFPSFLAFVVTRCRELH
jgi:hypothetical protein